HTRSKRDWSSDVCSSDLKILEKIWGPDWPPHFFVIFDRYSIVVPAFPARLSFAFSMDVIIAFRPFPASMKSMEASIFGSMEPARSEERRVGKEWRGRGTP